MSDSRCLVTGATGVIGPGLVKALVESGSVVTVLVRGEVPDNFFPPSVTVVKGDLLDAEALRKATAGVDTVFHLAAKLHLENPDEKLKDDYRNINSKGTRLLLDCAQSAGIRRFVYFSTIKVYGPSTQGRVFSELDTPAPEGIYAQTKYEAEKDVLAARAAGTGAPIGVVLRLSAVYGPHMKGNYSRLVKAIRKGLFIPIGDGLNRRTLVHERDVVAAALLAADSAQAAGQIFNVTDGQVHTFAEILSAISKVMNKRPPRLYLPVPPVRLLAGVVEDVFRFIGRHPPVGRATVETLVEDVAVSGEKLKREMNFQPQFDLDRGWRDMIEGSRSPVS